MFIKDEIIPLQLDHPIHNTHKVLKMNEVKHGARFWIGNGLLALALTSLLFMGPLSENLGVWAMILWMVLAAVGMYFLMTDKGGEPGMPE